MLIYDKPILYKVFLYVQYKRRKKHIQLSN